MNKLPERHIKPFEISELCDIGQMFGFKQKRKNISKYLREHFGGNWKYDGMATWWCNDNKRHVSRTASCSCDDACNHPRIYIMYQEPFKVNRAIDWNLTLE